MPDQPRFQLLQIGLQMKLQRESVVADGESLFCTNFRERQPSRAGRQVISIAMPVQHRRAVGQGRER